MTAIQKTILIADDEHDFVSILSERLESNGYTTVKAFEGIRAIESAHKFKPDLILLDLKMPAGTGQSVLQSLKKHPETKQIPVIVVTALIQPGLEREVLRGGAVGFFQKPFDMNLLLSKIDTLFEK